ncbi:MAG: hypothetical protein HYU32_10400, partial [candidate division NC10 bacterium]|nr:hypothetical protein [candidate division NC10 bacterium]
MALKTGLEEFLYPGEMAEEPFAPLGERPGGRGPSLVLRQEGAERLEDHLRPVLSSLPEQILAVQLDRQPVLLGQGPDLMLQEVRHAFLDDQNGPLPSEKVQDLFGDQRVNDVQAEDFVGRA